MTIIVLLFGALIVLLGLVGLVEPGRFRSMFGKMDSQVRFVFAVVVRLVIGAFIWWVADDLRYPQLMRAFAIIAVVAAVGILVMGRTRLDRLVDWWLGKPDGVVRISAIFATAFGAFLIYVAT